MSEHYTTIMTVAGAIVAGTFAAIGHLWRQVKLLSAKVTALNYTVGRSSTLVQSVADCHIPDCPHRKTAAHLCVGHVKPNETNLFPTSPVGE